MLCLNAEEYIKRTSSVKETGLLRAELQTYLNGQPVLQSRTLCDRVVRACNHHLGVNPSDKDHVHELVELVKAAVDGYDKAGGDAVQRSRLYMEKIVFHILKKVSPLKIHSVCSDVAELLHARLFKMERSADYSVLVRSCFSVLWNRPQAPPYDKLHSQLQALSFLLLVGPESDSSLASKAPFYAQDAICQFDNGCGSFTKEDSVFLLKEIQKIFSKFWTIVGKSGDNHQIRKFHLFPMFHIVAISTKVLTKAGHYDMAMNFLDDIESKVGHVPDCHSTSLVLTKLAVKIHSATKASQEVGQFLTEGARALRSRSDIDDHEANALLEACGLMTWAIESGPTKGLSGSPLLALYSFLEEHQEVILKVLNQKSICQSQTEKERLQQMLCFSLYQGFTSAHESMQASQLEDTSVLDRVLLFCQASAGPMMKELKKLDNDNLCIKAVVAVSNFACELYNRRLYDQAFGLLEFLCKDLVKNAPKSLSANQFSRPFMMAVQSSRRAGRLHRALDWVILWLKALGDKIPGQMTEPVSLWVKTKMEALGDTDDDIRLRTLRDGFGTDAPDEVVMISLLEEELRVYKEVPGDTAQKQYNTLCDLLDICHEESPRTHLRAVYLCEMAQVVCFRDFSEQTNCSAVDFTHEALLLLEAEKRTSENSDRLADDKAHTLLWMYICTLERMLQEAVAKDKKREDLREQTQCTTMPTTIWTNDDMQNNREDSNTVYEGLHLSLEAQTQQLQPLDRALSCWATLLGGAKSPTVRNPKQTCSSIALMASLFRLQGKPLKALEAYELAVGLAKKLAETHCCAAYLCHSASVLLEMGSPELALSQIEKAEKSLSSESASEGPSHLSVQVTLLKAQHCFITGQISLGVPYLCEVLREANERKQTKSWYLLRAQALRTVGSYLCLDVQSLTQAQRTLIHQHGINNPDTAVYEGLKLFCSLLVTLVGKGLYGKHGSSDTGYNDQGKNQSLKWQLLFELLSCSVMMVSVRSRSGAVNDARLQCLEALKLAIKLQAFSQCAELLVLKAELELMQGEKGESGVDLDKVRHLLEINTDLPAQKKLEKKIKPRKGHPAQKQDSPLPPLEDDIGDILNTRWIHKEFVQHDLTCSPPLKVLPRRWLSSLSHKSDCACRVCLEPCLSRVTVRWAAVCADLELQLDSAQAKTVLKLYWVALAHAKNTSAKLGGKLDKIFGLKAASKPYFLQAIEGQIYQRIALCGLDPNMSKVFNVWKALEAGLSFAESTPNPVMQPFKAGLKATKAVLSLGTLASNKGCLPEELFSHVWIWKLPKEMRKSLKFGPASPKQTIKVEPKSEDGGKVQNTDKMKEPKKTRNAKPRLDSASSTRGRGLLPVTPRMTPVTAKSTSGELSVFDFSTAIPTLACTPVHKVKPPASAQKAPKTASKFQVFQELSPEQENPKVVPAAPRRTRRLRFMVDFSDESDTEANPLPAKKELAVPKTRSLKKSIKTPRDPSTPVPAKTPTTKRTKKNTATVRTTCSKDEEHVKRGRAKRTTRAAKEESEEDLDKMRTIDEETPEVLDMSAEQLRVSDTENIEESRQNLDFEILKREMLGLGKGDLFELKNREQPTERAPTQQLHDYKLDELSVDNAKSLLSSAWLTLQHFPSPGIASMVCALIALGFGQVDPATTAMLHIQSLGISSRHRTIRHLSGCLKKLKRDSTDLKDRMEALTLKDPNPDEPKLRAAQRLTQLEEIFSFPISDSPDFPKTCRQEFTQIIQNIPPGVCVCLLSTVGLKPGQMGDTLLLSRLERDSAPVTVLIPSSRQQRPLSWMVQEIDDIQAEQKVVGCVAEKAQWWAGRKALDSRVEELLDKMEETLVCWKSLLSPPSSDPDLLKLVQSLQKGLAAKGVHVGQEMLKPVLSAAPVLTDEDLKTFAFGVCPQWDAECEQLLQSAVSQLSDREETKGHIVLILDKFLQKLPWESMSFLKSRSVSRMPSLQSLIGLSIDKEIIPNSILKRGVDSKKVFYVLDPDGNLENSKERFKECFSSKTDWEGVCGVAPDSDKLTEAISSKDLYMYVGHGAGARFLDSQVLLKRQIRAAALLFGCSSAALAVRGEQEGQGILLYYLIAGCPFVLGNLWDVTDRDIDRFTKALLESWLSAGPGAPLLEHMGPARDATYLKNLIGAAPVVYGLPIHLL